MDPVFYQPTATPVEAFRPLGDFVLVRRIDVNEQPQGLLVMAQRGDVNDRGGVRRGVVVDCGPGDKLKRGGRAAMNVAPGDEVLYTRAPANVVNFDGVEYDLLHEQQHILAVLEQ